MSDRTVVDSLNEWQTGAFLVLGSALGGVAVLLVAGRALSGSPMVGLGSFLVGAILAFVVLSYVLYGR